MSAALSPFWWRRSEIETLREAYPAGGAKQVSQLLPHRSPTAIYAKAQLLGLRRPKGIGSRGKRVR